MHTIAVKLVENLALECKTSDFINAQIESSWYQQHKFNQHWQALRKCKQTSFHNRMHLQENREKTQHYKVFLFFVFYFQLAFFRGFQQTVPTSFWLARGIEKWKKRIWERWSGSLSCTNTLESSNWDNACNLHTNVIIICFFFVFSFLQSPFSETFPVSSFSGDYLTKHWIFNQVKCMATSMKNNLQLKQES